MYNASYMDGVPVKIAEKYKPPPPMYKLPQHLTNKLNLEEKFYWNCPVFSCDLHLEKKALPKIEQWKRIRQRNKEQRMERILKRVEQRRREDEDKQKALLYCVSYPNADDLSSEEEETLELDTKYKVNGRDISEPKETGTQMRDAEKVNSFHNILQPTVLSFNSSSTANNELTPIIKSTFDSKISSSFNYKDFEEDTSSPFDNIELKTINDLDVLAQVLHNTQVKSASNEILNVVTAISSDNINEIPNSCYPEREHSKEILGKAFIAAENIPMPNNILPQSNYDFKTSQRGLTHCRDHHLIAESAMHHEDNLSSPSLSPALCNTLNNSTGYYNYQSHPCTNKTDSINLQFDRQHTLSDDQMTKSKSVPDIIKELKDDIRKSEIKRHRNCSYNMEDTIEHIAKINDADNEDIFYKLDGKSKQLIEQITAMGFPFKRVARIVQLVGTDDKKVVEHLIPLSELADLGFEEGKISDALIRNKNNKNKALDDLIT